MGLVCVRSTLSCVACLIRSSVVLSLCVCRDVCLFARLFVCPCLYVCPSFSLPSSVYLSVYLTICLSSTYLLSSPAYLFVFCVYISLCLYVSFTSVGRSLWTPNKSATDRCCFTITRLWRDANPASRDLETQHHILVLTICIHSVQWHNYGQTWELHFNIKYFSNYSPGGYVNNPAMSSERDRALLWSFFVFPCFSYFWGGVFLRDQSGFIHHIVPPARLEPWPQVSPVSRISFAFVAHTVHSSFHPARRVSSIFFLSNCFKDFAHAPKNKNKTRKSTRHAVCSSHSQNTSY